MHHIEDEEDALVRAQNENSLPKERGGAAENPF